MIQYRTCVACTNLVPRANVLCKACYSTYYQYRHEPWFKELAKLQNKQDIIDKFESGEMPINSKSDLYGDNVDRPQEPLRKKIGQPGLNLIDAQKILDVYDEVREEEKQTGKKLSYRTISKLVYQRHKIKISHVSVWALVGKYRKEHK